MLRAGGRLLLAAPLYPAQCLAASAAALQAQRGVLSSAVATARTPPGDVPGGHAGSDLTPATCHIGLMRLRDLTLRADLCLWQGPSKSSLAGLFKVRAGCGGGSGWW